MIVQNGEWIMKWQLKMILIRWNMINVVGHVGEWGRTELWLGLVQLLAALDGTYGDKIFWMYASANIAIYAIEMTELEVHGNLITLQQSNFQLFSKNDVIIKYEVKQSSIHSIISIFFHYYLQRDVDVAHCITTNALFSAEIEMLQLHCVFFEDAFFKLI